MIEHIKCRIDCIKSIVLFDSAGHPQSLLINWPIYVMPMVPVFSSPGLYIIWPRSRLNKVCRHPFCVLCNCEHDVVGSFPDLWRHADKLILGDLSYCHVAHARPSKTTPEKASKQDENFHEFRIKFE